MIEQGRGHIVTIASAAGLVGTARQTDYAASK
ncbi:SDR family NAD(P)-dependent oxidoreductase, partial [Actibacterium sp.]